MKKGATYESAGVNIELGDDVSKILYNAAKQTWDNRKGRLGELIVPFDDFSGVRAIDVSNLPNGSLMNIGFDGVGTKMELAERINNHRTIAYDLFAMVCDDAVVRGAEPILIGSILDVNSLGKGKEKSYIEQVKQLAEGYINAANDAGVAIVNGEVAELGNRVGGFGDFNYNWGASVVWFAKRERLFTGKEIKKGDSIVGLREEGFRSNGLSLVRKILQENFGDDWHKKEFHGTGQTIGELVLTPSKIYSKAVCKMFGGYDREPKAKVHGVAHLTGGGLPGKLGRVLKPSGLGANITNPYNPSLIMDFIQELGDVSDEEAYKTWNMGQGMAIITPEPEKVIGLAVGSGIPACYIGKVVEKPGVRILNKGTFKVFQTEKFLEFKE
jgi:phosphoribosylformylglycinamidine cyclo-ligase